MPARGRNTFRRVLRGSYVRRSAKRSYPLHKKGRSIGPGLGEDFREPCTGEVLPATVQARGAVPGGRGEGLRNWGTGSRRLRASSADNVMSVLCPFLQVSQNRTSP